MRPRDYIEKQIGHEETSPVPYTFACEENVAEQLDEYYGNRKWRSKTSPYIARVAAVDTDPREPIDDNHARDGFGGIWRTDRRPWHLEEPPLSSPSLKGYGFPKAETFFRPEWKEEAWETCERGKNRFIIAGLGWGLFERSWNLRGFENILMDAITEPDFYEEILDRLTELYLEFVDYTCELPVDAVLFGDDWGDQRGVILGPDRWRRFLKPRWSRIYDRVHDAGKIVMSHCCGSIADIIPDIIEMEMDVLESVQPEAAGMSPYELKERVGDELTFWGGLGSQSIIPHGTPEEIHAEVRRLCREVGRGGGYILAPAKPLQPETPTENAVAVFEAFSGQNAG